MFSGFASALQITYLLGSLTIQSYICQPPSAPTLVNPVDGSSVVAGVPFTVAGTGPEESAIIVSLDGAPSASVQADASNQFSANVTLSNAGSHTIAVEASRSCGSAQGSVITVEAIQSTTPPVDPDDPTGPESPVTPGAPSTGPNASNPIPGPNTPSTEAPKPATTSDEQETSKGLSLSISAPTNFSTTTDESVFVTGTTNKPAIVTIWVNGTQAGSTMTPLATFGLGVPLEVGKNTIVVSATAQDGTSASVKLDVTRQSPSEQASWASSESGQATIRIVAISAVSILLILAIIGICLP